LAVLHYQIGDFEKDKRLHVADAHVMRIGEELMIRHTKSIIVAVLFVLVFISVSGAIANNLDHVLRGIPAYRTHDLWQQLLCDLFGSVLLGWNTILIYRSRAKPVKINITLLALLLSQLVLMGIITQLVVFVVDGYYFEIGDTTTNVLRFIILHAFMMVASAASLIFLIYASYRLSQTVEPAKEIS
jgi:hypothetical protein